MIIPRRFALFAISFACVLAPLFASAATMSAAPGRTSVSVGDTVNVTVTVSSQGEALNAISGTLSFPSNLLSVVSVSRASSILTLWVQEPSSSSGTVSWSGLVPNPGWSGYSGTVLVIQFRARATGTATFSFVSSAVLANDGQGTNILTGTAPGSLAIGPASAPPPASATPPSSSAEDSPGPIISSPTHPDQSAWYNRSDGVFEWTNARGVTAVRLGYDTDPDGEPLVSYSPPISRKELELEEGIWYFHVQERDAGGWGPGATYRVQVDTVPPEPFSIAFPEGTSAEESVPVRFGTTDRLSGIDRYVVSIDGEERVVGAAEEGGVYELTARPGTHAVSVTAYDKAGNAASAHGSFTIEAGPSPIPYALLWRATNYLSAGLIALAALALAGYLGWYLWHHFHAFRRRYPGSLEHTHRVVGEQFTELQDALIAEIASLEKVRNRRELTREEARVITNLKRLIKRTQFAVEDEIVKHGKQS